MEEFCTHRKTGYRAVCVVIGGTGKVVFVRRLVERQGRAEKAEKAGVGAFRGVGGGTGKIITECAAIIPEK
jgi:hypothetical protein